MFNQEFLDPNKCEIKYEMIAGKDGDKREVVPLQNTIKHPYKSIGFISCEFPDHPSNQIDSFGTGSIYGSNIALTCAHVVHNVKYNKTSKHVIFQIQKGQGQKHKIKVLNTLIHPLYQNGLRREYDIAVLQLEQNPYITPEHCLQIKWDYDFQRYKQHYLNLTGYPKDLNHAWKKKAQKNKPYIYQQAQDQRKGLRQIKSFIYYEHSTDNGNSGAPVLLKQQVEKGKYSYSTIGLHQGCTTNHNYCILLKTLENQLFIQLHQSIQQAKQANKKVKDQKQQIKNQNDQITILKHKLQSYQKREKQRQKYSIGIQKKLAQTITELQSTKKRQLELLSIGNNLKKSQQSLKKEINNQSQTVKQLLIQIDMSQTLSQQQILKIKNLESVVDSLSPKLLSSSQYLNKTFKTNQQIQTKYYKTSKNINSLNLSRNGIDMKQFIKYDWKDRQFIDLKFCDINDEGWKILVQNAHLFENLIQIQLNQNKITTINEGDLDKFRKIQAIDFGRFEYSNPLKKQSKDVVKKFMDKNKNVKVRI